MKRRRERRTSPEFGSLFLGLFCRSESVDETLVRQGLRIFLPGGFFRPAGALSTEIQRPGWPEPAAARANPAIEAAMAVEGRKDGQGS